MVNRRNILKTLGVALFSSTGASALAKENALRSGSNTDLFKFFGTVDELKNDTSLKENQLAKTIGYHKIADGGHAEYIIYKSDKIIEGSITLKNGLQARIINAESVNYKMFGTLSDGTNDDGIQIKAAHAYANTFNLPVINLSGEFWIKETNGIKILNNVDWGNTIFYIDEKFNTSKASRFEILSSKKELEITLNSTQKSNLLKQLKPGAKVIPELASYKNSLVIIADKDDQIGFRAGEKYVGQSWDREELFFVEEHGRIIGDIAWTFKGYTSLIAYPADDTFLTVNGGCFYLSGDSSGKGYTRNGFNISRSRSIIQNQWVGLEPGRNDNAPNPRTGFYTFSKVYNVILENVRLIPYEQDREGKEHDVPAGTYGISAARMLNGTFRNITGEGGPIHWGVFGTNLNKNFKIENCSLNRVDVHFHCWNLHIKDSQIGYRGVSVTGGGDLTVENTSCASASFINFRRDFGAKWDGNIRINNCKFIPSGGINTVLDFNPMDFDHKYPVGFGRSISVTNLIVDYTGSDSKAICWIIKTPSFSKMKHGQRLFFPNFIEFKNILVQGRESGVRLMKISNPAGLDTGKRGVYDGVELLSNSTLLFDNIQLENLESRNLSSTEENHFILLADNDEKVDESSLYPEIIFERCKGLVCSFGKSADVSFRNCSIMKIGRIKEEALSGRYNFTNCLIQPSAINKDFISISVASELGTSFTNCTLHSPKINGVLQPELLSLVDIIQINKTVKYNHLNTLLGRDIISFYKKKGISFNEKFISMLKSHHELESEKE